MSEEVELIVESLLGVLLRTILEISNRPQPAGPPMRLQVQDVTVSASALRLFQDLAEKVMIDPKRSRGAGNPAAVVDMNGRN